MKIGLLTVQVPFIRGGAEILADELKLQLQKHGHQAEIISIPFKWYPIETLYTSMVMGRMVEVQESAYQKIDGIIGLKFPAYYAAHTNKVLWLVHQHRQAYDLFGTQFGDLHQSAEGKKVSQFIRASDNQFLSDYRQRYTISRTVADRLNKYNSLKSTALYHPPHDSEKLFCEKFEKFIFYPSRIDQMKRQWLLIECARYLKTDVKIKIAGAGSADEIKKLRKLIQDYSLEERVELLGLISNEEKLKLYSRCSAVYNGVYDEDYGYVTLEGMFSRKPILVHSDAGGPLEFINSGENGFVVDLNPQNLAAKIDEIVQDRGLAEKMGEAGYKSLLRKEVSWENTISKLTASLN
jgi:glycosyltransferase involved in cell wall biosynthesis